jgi:hypothetical protein
MKTSREYEHVWASWAREAHAATPPVNPARGRARLLAAQRSLAPRARARLRRRVWGLAVCVALLPLIARLVWFRPITFERAGVHEEPGAWLATDGAAELPLRFSEGTEVLLLRGSRGRVDELRTRGARVALERGTLRAHVTHRLRTDWHFVAGPFEVEVTGTSLEVGWDPERERFSTAVTSGAVKVMGPSVGAEVVVREGQRCDVDLRRHTMQLSRIESPETPSRLAPTVSPQPTGAPAPAETAAIPSPPSAPSAPTEVAPEPATPEPATPAPANTAPAALPANPDAARLKRARPHAPAAEAALRWTQLEEQARYDEAFAAVERAGVRATVAAANDKQLLRLAHLARAVGRANVEHQALVACRTRFAHTPSSGIAAYELGRTATPERAAHWFATYLAEQSTGPLAEQASGRLVEALELAGRHAEAVVAAHHLLERFADGSYASLARRVVGLSPK